jgi:hypothetical protein
MFKNSVRIIVEKIYKMGCLEGSGVAVLRCLKVKLDLQEVGWGMDCIGLILDRDRWRALVNAVMKLQVP